VRGGGGGGVQVQGCKYKGPMIHLVPQRESVYVCIYACICGKYAYSYTTHIYMMIRYYGSICNNESWMEVLHFGKYGYM